MASTNSGELALMPGPIQSSYYETCLICDGRYLVLSQSFMRYRNETITRISYFPKAASS